MEKSVPAQPVEANTNLSFGLLIGLAVVVISVAGITLLVYRYRIQSPEIPAAELLSRHGAIQFPPLTASTPDEKPVVSPPLHRFVLSRARAVSTATLRYQNGKSGSSVTYTLASGIPTVRIYEAYRIPENLKEWTLMAAQHTGSFAFFDLQNDSSLVRITYQQDQRGGMVIEIQSVQK